MLDATGGILRATVGFIGISIAVITPDVPSKEGCGIFRQKVKQIGSCVTLLLIECALMVHESLMYDRSLVRSLCEVVVGVLAPKPVLARKDTSESFLTLKMHARINVLMASALTYDVVLSNEISVNATFSRSGTPMFPT